MDLKQKDATYSASNSVVDPSNTVLPVEDSGDSGERECRLEVQPEPGPGRGPDEPEGRAEYFEAISPSQSLDDWVRRELGDLE